jgi:hypothetical protein
MIDVVVLSITFHFQNFSVNLEDKELATIFLEEIYRQQVFSLVGIKCLEKLF